MGKVRDYSLNFLNSAIGAVAGGIAGNLIYKSIRKLVQNRKKRRAAGELSL